MAALIKRRFSSAAVVRSEAFQNQTTTIMTKAPRSAAALKLPRPTHRAMVTVLRLTLRERPGDAFTPVGRHCNQELRSQNWGSQLVLAHAERGLKDGSTRYPKHERATDARVARRIS